MTKGTRARTIVFDIGGTWFRAGVWTETGELVGRARQPAINFRSHPDADCASLQERLVDYLMDETRRLASEHGPTRHVVISMGAALNARTGLVLDSGPLWGPDSQPFDLAAELRKRDPTRSWQVVNDVTALLLRHVHSVPLERRQGRMALITISSGIACRVFDFARQEVPTDPAHGLQGEIGHLEVACEFAGSPISLRCDCGGMNHLNAFASGRGLEALVRHLSKEEPVDIAAFLAAARDGDDWSAAVLASALRPLARILAVMLTHDPELDPILFVGGVVAALREVFLHTLLDELQQLGMYQITERDPDYFRRRLHLGFLDDDSGLIGCGLHTQTIRTTSS